MAQRSKPQAKKTLVGVIGSAVAAASLFVLVPKEESGRTVKATVNADQSVTVEHVAGKQYLEAYLDVIRVPTACDGITKGVKIGMKFTPAQCNQMLEEELIAHAEPIVACAPALRGRADQVAAAVSISYNVGTGGFCGSSIAKQINAGNWPGAADAFLAWDRVTVPAAQVAAYRRRGERCAPKRGGGWLCTLKGLTDRRKRERALFLRELPR